MAIDSLAAPGPSGRRMPPLTWQEHLWRVLACTALGLATLVVVFADMPDPDHVSDRVGLLLFVDIFVALPAALGLLLLHRRFPLSVATVLTVLGGPFATVGAASGLCLLSVSSRRRPQEIVPLAVLSVAVTTASAGLYPQKDPLPRWVEAALVSVVVAAIVSVGLYLGTRRELVDSWRLRAESADREQAVAAERAREAERARIAREMHDVLAHRLSQVSMHAGVLAFRADLGADDVRAEAKVVQEASRQALDELRAVLGVLRHTDAGEPPQPSLADLDGLVVAARAAGPVGLEVQLEGVPPAPLGRHAYRVVQEGLTNARKHAPGAPVTVRVAGRPGGAVDVEVSNGPPPGPAAEASAGGGFGLVGLAERAALAGGTMTSGRTSDGGFALHVRLPWPAGEGEETA